MSHAGRFYLPDPSDWPGIPRVIRLRSRPNRHDRDDSLFSLRMFQHASRFVLSQNRPIHHHGGKKHKCVSFTFACLGCLTGVLFAMA